MTTAVRTKAAASRPGNPAKTKPASQPAVGEVEAGMVDKQPQVKEKAAVARGMFLYADDAWAQRYFDPNDLHFRERQVFG